MGALKFWDGTQWLYVNSSDRGSALSNMVIATATNISTTTAVDITGLTITLTSPGPSAVFMVDASLDLTMNVVSATFVGECVVDGVAQSAQIVFSSPNVGTRTAGAKRWRITGLATGSHTIKITGRLTAAAVNAVTVNGLHSVMEVEQSLFDANSVSSVQATAPVSPQLGQQWYDTTYGIEKLWTGSAWEAVGAGAALKKRVNVTANSAAFSAETVLATLPAITVDGNTEIELVFSWYNFSHTVTTDTVQCYLYDGATAGSGTILQVWLQAFAANGGSGTMRWRGIPSAGTHTYTARAARTAGTGTATMVAVATDPAQLTVTPV